MRHRFVAGLEELLGLLGQGQALEVGLAIEIAPQQHLVDALDHAGLGIAGQQVALGGVVDKCLDAGGQEVPDGGPEARCGGGAGLVELLAEALPLEHLADVEARGAQLLDVLEEVVHDVLGLAEGDLAVAEALGHVALDDQVGGRLLFLLVVPATLADSQRGALGDGADVVDRELGGHGFLQDGEHFGAAAAGVEHALDSLRLLGQPGVEPEVVLELLVERLGFGDARLLELQLPRRIVFYLPYSYQQDQYNLN